eukprot:scaffold20587_cov110-Isochrysis_galbana.AAC.1
MSPWSGKHEPAPGNPTTTMSGSECASSSSPNQLRLTVPPLPTGMSCRVSLGISPGCTLCAVWANTVWSSPDRNQSGGL